MNLYATYDHTLVIYFPVVEFAFTQYEFPLISRSCVPLGMNESFLHIDSTDHLFK